MTFSGADLGGCAGCVHPPPPPHLRVTCGFLIQLVFCIKIYFHHQSVKPLLGAAPFLKKNPGPAPDFVFVSDKVSAKTRTVHSTERNVTRVNLAAITEVLSGLNSDKPHGLKTVT